MKKVGLASRNYSTPSKKKKNILRCVGFCLYILNFNAVEGGSRGGTRYGVGQRRLSPGSFQEENTEK